jgi:hypothetical protein
MTAYAKSSEHSPTILADPSESNWTYSSTQTSGVEAARMRKKNKKPLPRKIFLRLPDLDHAKTSVLNTLSSPNSRRNYRFAMEQFITWYCSEPRLALNRVVVLRFRLHLESLGLASGTINQRLAAVRRLAYEAVDTGLLSPDLAAGIRRVKGVKQLGSRAGNWLSRDQARLLLEKSDGEGLLLIGTKDSRESAIAAPQKAMATPSSPTWDSCRRVIVSVTSSSRLAIYQTGIALPSRRPKSRKALA